jgi:2-hydroxychromene-2-carboxylate isomerase
VIAGAQGDANKLRLRRMVEEAQARGIFGAPAFVAEDRELFWGNDRLERALDWVTGQARRSELPV